MKRLLLLLTLAPCIAFGQVIDVDSNTYKTVKIGDQVWMAENLKVSHFRNGDSIPEAKTLEDWEKAGDENIPAWCYYDNDPSNGEKYGKLYNWWAVNDSRGLAPEGWHIPTDKEWKTLTNNLGAEDVIGVKMKSTSGWAAGGDGTNESGFSGLSGGARSHDGSFTPHKLEYISYWWTSTEYNATLAWYRFLSYNYGVISWDYGEKKHGFYVRCVKD